MARKTNIKLSIEEIDEFRDKGLEWAEIAKKCGVDRSNLSKWLKRNFVVRHIPKAKITEKTVI